VTSPNRSPKPSEDSIKETLESIVIAFILAFVFRAYVVEAFVIPTGSMAPTLLGRHLRVVCTQCGYTFKVDPEAQDLTETVLGKDGRKRSYVRSYITRPEHAPLRVVCPMCHYSNPIKRGSRISAGDRILVQKYIYSLSEPKRWDVIVFKAPHEPGTNYIKRLVGLPHEKLSIIEGNLYVQPQTDSPGPWGIARKTERPAVQQAVWQPICDTQYEPLDGGRANPARVKHPWQQPWRPANSRRWELHGRRGYRFKGPQTGTLQLNFAVAVQGGPGLYAYNQLKQNPRGFESVEDIRLMAVIEPDGPGLSVKLRTTTRLDDPNGRPLLLVGQVTQGTITLQATHPDTGQTVTLASTTLKNPFTPHQSTSIELWYVDQEASLWINGKKELLWQFDLPMETMLNRKGPNPMPSIAVELSGSGAMLHRLKVDRDLYYGSISPNGNPARGGIYKRGSGHHGNPVEMKANQFFCCGDNSPLSADSRYWSRVNPWIEANMFDPADSDGNVYGIVPRRLIMGRAFFVYFPSPMRLKSNYRALIPNFGDMRFIN